MNSQERLNNYLEKYINQTIVNDSFGVYYIKELVSKIRNMKIEIYSNDHNPPHFHIKSNDQSINATFTLDGCKLIKGNIKSDDIKRIQAFYKDSKTQILMNEMWMKSKSSNKKVD